jgi:hypothetical protein
LASKGIMTELTSFFAGPAYRVGWTKDLLEAVSAGAGTGSKAKSVGFGGFGGLLGQLKGLGGLFANLGGILLKALPVLGSALAVGAAAFAGWKAGRWLGENVKWGGKTLDEHVQGGITKLIGGDEKSQLKKSALEQQHPIVKRALELQAQGVPFKEAQAQAEQENKGFQSGFIPPPGTPDVVRTGVGKTPGQSEPVGKMPIDTTAEEGLKLQREATTQLSTTMGEVKDLLGKATASKGTTNRGGTDAYDTKDPLVSGLLNSGRLDID